MDYDLSEADVICVWCREHGQRGMDERDVSCALTREYY